MSNGLCTVNGIANQQLLMLCQIMEFHFNLTNRLGVAVHLDALQLPGNRSDGLRRSTVGYCPIGSTTYDQNPVEQTPSDSTLSVDGEDTRCVCVSE